MPLPFLLDSITAQAIAAQEECLCDLAESMAQFGSVGCQYSDEALTHRHAVMLANELLWAHESGSPTDADLLHAATQLKLWHLTQIDNLTTVKP